MSGTSEIKMEGRRWTDDVVEESYWTIIGQSDGTVRHMAVDIIIFFVILR